MFTRSTTGRRAQRVVRERVPKVLSIRWGDVVHFFATMRWQEQVALAVLTTYFVALFVITAKQDRRSKAM